MGTILPTTAALVIREAPAILALQAMAQVTAPALHLRVRAAVPQVPARLRAPDPLAPGLPAALRPLARMLRRLDPVHPRAQAVRRVPVAVLVVHGQDRIPLQHFRAGLWPARFQFSASFVCRCHCSILFCVQSEDILSQKPPDPDLRIPYGQDPNQFVDVRIPSGKGPHPVVFFIHGGYWRAKYDLTYAGHLCAALKKAGIATWNVEYRRVGNPGGGWPGTFEDVRSAYRALREHKNDSLSKIDLKKLCVSGHSAGGQLALCLAAFENSVTRVFSLAGVLDLRRAWDLHLSSDAAAAFLGGSPTEVPDHYHEASPAERSIPQARQKLIHGTTDDSVPYEMSQNYAAKKKQAGEQVELITLPNIGHFEIVDPGSAVWKQVENTFIALTRS